MDDTFPGGPVANDVYQQAKFTIFGFPIKPALFVEAIISIYRNIIISNNAIKCQKPRAFCPTAKSIDPRKY